MTASVAYLGYRFTNEPNARDLITVVGVWSALNLILTGIALGAVSERRERRGMPRVASQFKASLAVEGVQVPVVIDDMSFGGLRVRALEALRLPARAMATLRIADDDGGPVLETPVVAAGRRTADEGSGFGLKFYGTQGDRFRIIAKVVFSDIAPVHARRSTRYRHLGLASGTVMFAWWWASQTARGLVYAALRRVPPAHPSLDAKTESSAL